MSTSRAISRLTFPDETKVLRMQTKLPRLPIISCNFCNVVLAAQLQTTHPGIQPAEPYQHSRRSPLAVILCRRATGSREWKLSYLQGQSEKRITSPSNSNTIAQSYNAVKPQGLILTQHRDPSNQRNLTRRNVKLHQTRGALARTDSMLIRVEATTSENNWGSEWYASEQPIQQCTPSLTAKWWG